MSASLTDIQKQLDQIQGALDLLSDLASTDKDKIKEARRYEDNFLNGDVLVQTLHEQGTYEPMDSIKKRAFARPSAGQLAIASSFPTTSIARQPSQGWWHVCSWTTT